MRLSVDAQPLINSLKSGIGYFGHNIVKELCESGDTDVVLEFFAFRHPKEKIRSAEKYHDLYGAELDHCNWFSMRAYLLLTSILPVSRDFFFKGGSDANFFFNFILPPGVKGKKSVVVHDMVFRDCPETASFKTKTLLKMFVRGSLKRADVVFTVSEFSKERIIHYYRIAPEKIMVIPCGVDAEIFKPCTNPEAIGMILSKYKISGSYILYLGTLEPRKNLLNLIKAYFLFTQKSTDHPKLVIAGSKGWMYGDIFEYVKNHSMEQDVIFTGYVSDEEKPLLINGAEFFCFPSLYEGFGMPILEAMACGTPVLTSNTTSMPEVGGDACEYCDPFSISSIADKMSLLWEKPERRQELSGMGIERSKQFRWSLSAEKVKEALSRS